LRSGGCVKSGNLEDTRCRSRSGGVVDGGSGVLRVGNTVAVVGRDAVGLLSLAFANHGAWRAGARSADVAFRAEGKTSQAEERATGLSTRHSCAARDGLLDRRGRTDRKHCCAAVLSQVVTNSYYGSRLRVKSCATDVRPLSLAASSL